MRDLAYQKLVGSGTIKEVVYEREKMRARTLQLTHCWQLGPFDVQREGEFAKDLEKIPPRP